MSTRATYRFKSEYNDSTIYIHHDGYQEGAAFYFYNAFVNNGNLTAESLIRGNDKAEITESHQAHGDTEYRYTIGGQSLKVLSGYGDKWHTVFNGDWVDFINDNINQGWFNESVSVLKRITCDTYGRKQVFTPESLQKQIDDDLRLLGQWSINGHTDSCNSKDLVARIKLMQGHINSFGFPEWVKAA